MTDWDDLRLRVLERDGFRCVAPVLDERAGQCRDLWGTPIRRWVARDPGRRFLEMSHTKASDELMMSKKADDDIDHLVALCPHHHRGTDAGSNWEARQRHLIRRYLGLR
jgi:hypothetical protein